MAIWKKIDRNENQEGTTITYQLPGTDLTIESRKRHIPHANGIGTWDHTTYVVIVGGQDVKTQYSLADAKEYAEGLETVNIAIEKHGIEMNSETLIHSDQGVHYTSYKFIQILKDANLRQSMSRRGNCWDNAPQESFFGHMKDEIDLKECETFEQVKAVIDDWIDYYNRERYVWDLAYLSPDEYYQFCLTGVYPLNVPIPKRCQATWGSAPNPEV